MAINCFMNSFVKDLKEGNLIDTNDKSFDLYAGGTRVGRFFANDPMSDVAKSKFKTIRKIGFYFSPSVITDFVDKAGNIISTGGKSMYEQTINRLSKFSEVSLNINEKLENLVKQGIIPKKNKIQDYLNEVEVKYTKNIKERNDLINSRYSEDFKQIVNDEIKPIIENRINSKLETINKKNKIEVIDDILKDSENVNYNRVKEIFEDFKNNTNYSKETLYRKTFEYLENEIDFKPYIDTKLKKVKNELTNNIIKKNLKKLNKKVKDYSYNIVNKSFDYYKGLDENQKSIISEIHNTNKELIQNGNNLEIKEFERFDKEGQLLVNLNDLSKMKQEDLKNIIKNSLNYKKEYVFDEENNVIRLMNENEFQKSLENKSIEIIKEINENKKIDKFYNDLNINTLLENGLIDQGILNNFEKFNIKYNSKIVSKETFNIENDSQFETFLKSLDNQLSSEGATLKEIKESKKLLSDLWKLHNNQWGIVKSNKFTEATSIVKNLIFAHNAGSISLMNIVELTSAASKIGMVNTVKSFKNAIMTKSNIKNMNKKDLKIFQRMLIRNQEMLDLGVSSKYSTNSFYSNDHVVNSKIGKKSQNLANIASEISGMKSGTFILKALAYEGFHRKIGNALKENLTKEITELKKYGLRDDVIDYINKNKNEVFDNEGFLIEDKLPDYALNNIQTTTKVFSDSVILTNNNYLNARSIVGGKINIGDVKENPITSTMTMFLNYMMMSNNAYLARGLNNKKYVDLAILASSQAVLLTGLGMLKDEIDIKLGNKKENERLKDEEILKDMILNMTMTTTSGYFNYIPKSYTGFTGKNFVDNKTYQPQSFGSFAGPVYTNILKKGSKVIKDTFNGDLKKAGVNTLDFANQFNPVGMIPFVNNIFKAGIKEIK